MRIVRNVTNFGSALELRQWIVIARFSVGNRIEVIELYFIRHTGDNKELSVFIKFDATNGNCTGSPNEVTWRR